MPRQRTARFAGTRVVARRPGRLSKRETRPIRARLVAAVLVFVSLGMITVYLRESSGGALHNAQRIGLSILAPLEVAGERVARPFQDAAGWMSDALDAKQENERLREQVEALRQQVIANQTAFRENEALRSLLQYQDSNRFPEDYRAVTTRVIGQPPNAFSQEVIVSAGDDDGVARFDPVVTEDGLVGLVSQVGANAAKVTLLSDQESAVSAVVLTSGAPGIIRHGESSATLLLDRVDKEQVVERGDTVVTAGWRSGDLESLFPYGIPIGTVTAVGQSDVDLYKRVQVTPLVDFDSVGTLVILVPTDRT